MHATADRIIYACLFALVVFGLTCFFANPLYAKGADLVLGALVAALTGSLGFKFGISQSGKPPDSAAGSE